MLLTSIWLICSPLCEYMAMTMNDYELVLLRHTISTMYHGISHVKNPQYITMKCVIGEQTRKVCCPLT